MIKLIKICILVAGLVGLDHPIKGEVTTLARTSFSHENKNVVTMNYQKHGMYKSKYYNLWCNIKSRCNRETAPNYERYGGRGIKIYAKWMHDFSSFYSYIKSLNDFEKEGYTLDRIDNDKNYEPNNLRWASVETQATNKRVRKNNKVGYSGIYRLPKTGKYETSVTVNYIKKHLGNYDSLSLAIKARNNYIIENELPHKIQKICPILR